MNKTTPSKANVVTVSFELDLDDPEQVQKYKELSGKPLSDLKSAMWSFSQETLRKYRKYGGTKDAVDAFIRKEWEVVSLQPEKATTEQYCQATAEMIEKEFYEALEENNASIED